MSENNKQNKDSDQAVDTKTVISNANKTDTLTPDAATKSEPEAPSGNKEEKTAKIKKTESSAAKKTRSKSLEKKPFLMKTLVTFSLVFSTLAVTISGWLYYQSLQNAFSENITTLSNQQNRLINQLNASTLNQPQLQKLSAQIQALETSKQSQDTIIASAQSEQTFRLDSFNAKLDRLDNTTKEDWKLAEAEYLIRLANQRLLLESDTDGAITLLTNADDILNALKDPITFSTRKALAKDIQALSATSAFDLEGAYLTLDALYDRVAELPQKEPSQVFQRSDNTTTPSIDSNTTKLQSTLNNLWSNLSSLVVITYDSKPIKALLPPAEYQELIAGLQLQIDIAQVSLIKREAVIYQHAITRVNDAINEYFDTQSNSVITFLQTLSTMQEINPAPELPQPRDSLLAIKSLMESWNNRSQTVNELTGGE